MKGDKPYYSSSQANWNGPIWCDDVTHSKGIHLHCDGPVKGDKVLWLEDGVENIATVTNHWHYEGCMINVEGHDLSLCPLLDNHLAPILMVAKEHHEEPEQESSSSS